MLHSDSRSSASFSLLLSLSNFMKINMKDSLYWKGEEKEKERKRERRVERALIFSVFILFLFSFFHYLPFLLSSLLSSLLFPSLRQPFSFPFYYNLKFKICLFSFYLQFSFVISLYCKLCTLLSSTRQVDMPLLPLSLPHSLSISLSLLCILSPFCSTQFFINFHFMWLQKIMKNIKKCQSS